VGRPPRPSRGHPCPPAAGKPARGTANDQPCQAHRTLRSPLIEHERSLILTRNTACRSADLAHSNEVHRLLFDITPESLPAPAGIAEVPVPSPPTAPSGAPSTAHFPAPRALPRTTITFRATGSAAASGHRHAWPPTSDSSRESAIFGTPMPPGSKWAELHRMHHSGGSVNVCGLRSCSRRGRRRPAGRCGDTLRDLGVHHFGWA